MSETIYRTYTEGKLHYTGPDLESAIRAWDRATYSAGRSVAGGVAVAAYESDAHGMLQTRDGWILHVSEDGTTYLSPRIIEKN